MATILCIDDNELGGTLVGLYLTRVQHESVHADNGAAGLVKAHEIMPDVIIVDLMMPKVTLDGWDTISALKSDEKLAHIPVIALSALSVTQARMRAFEAGCDAYINKPSTPAELKDCIDRLLNKVPEQPPPSAALPGPGEPK